MQGQLYPYKTVILSGNIPLPLQAATSKVVSPQHQNPLLLLQCVLMSASTLHFTLETQN